MAYEVGRGYNRCSDVGLFDMVYQCCVGEPGRIVYFHHASALVVYAVAYVRHGGDYVHVEFAAEAFLHNFHMEQAEESAAETEAESGRRFGREC